MKHAEKREPHMSFFKTRARQVQGFTFYPEKSKKFIHMSQDDKRTKKGGF